MSSKILGGGGGGCEGGDRKLYHSTSNFLSAPDVKTGGCLGSERNGVRVGKVGESGPGPPERGKDKQSVPNKGRDKMGEDKKDQPSRT